MFTQFMGKSYPCEFFDREKDTWHDLHVSSQFLVLEQTKNQNTGSPLLDVWSYTHFLTW